MITLKDIKVSKNRIPVQNAIWLRPTGGLTFKIYYPHGDDWTEIKFDGSSPEPDPTPTPPQNLEERVETLENQYNSLTRIVSRHTIKIGNLEDKVKSLIVSVEKLYNSVDITTITFSKTLPMEGSVFNPIDYGIGNVEWKAYLEEKVTKAIIPDYDTKFSVIVTENIPVSSFVNHWFVSYLILKEETRRIVYTIVGIAEHIINAADQIKFYVRGEEQSIDEQTVYFETPLTKENHTGLNTETVAELGFTPEVIAGIMTEAKTKILMKDDPIEYVVRGLTVEYSEFYLFGYDSENNITHEFYFTGANTSSGWAYDIEYNTSPGDETQPEEE